MKQIDFATAVHLASVSCTPEGQPGECAFGARDEFHLAAIVQNLNTMVLRLLGPPPRGAPAVFAVRACETN
ncbi:hypothetical protein ACVMFA_009713 [Bradyrhizobium liaoningense]